jgi:hypothetical protein
MKNIYKMNYQELFKLKDELLDAGTWFDLSCSDRSYINLELHEYFMQTAREIKKVITL